MSRQEFASQIALSEQQADLLLNDKTQLTPKIAAWLETVLSVPAGLR